jgi:hypothetical protein
LVTGVNHGITKVKVPNRSPRFKHGLFDFFGGIGHTLFGLATDQGLKDVKRVVKETRREQHTIVHRVNDLVTVLNHTWDKIDEQTNQINLIKHYLFQARLAYMVLTNATHKALYALEVLSVMRHLDGAVTTFENLADDYLRVLDKYNRQKASLELGRLTEELLPPALLQDILKKGLLRL